MAASVATIAFTPTARGKFGWATDTSGVRAFSRGGHMSLLESVKAQAEDLFSFSYAADFDPPDATTLNRVVQDMIALRESAPEIWPPVLVPGADGSVQAEWDTTDIEMLFLVECDGQRVTYVFDRNANEEYEAFGDAALTLARRTVQKMVWKQTAPSSLAILDSRQSKDTAIFTSRLELASVL